MNMFSSAVGYPDMESAQIIAKLWKKKQDGIGTRNYDSSVVINTSTVHGNVLIDKIVIKKIPDIYMVEYIKDLLNRITNNSRCFKNKQ